MWIAMKDARIFCTPRARVTVIVAIVSHYAPGILSGARYCECEPGPPGNGRMTLVIDCTRRLNS